MSKRQKCIVFGFVKSEAAGQVLGSHLFVGLRRGFALFLRLVIGSAGAQQWQQIIEVEPLNHARQMVEHVQAGADNKDTLALRERVPELNMLSASCTRSGGRLRKKDDGLGSAKVSKVDLRVVRAVVSTVGTVDPFAFNGMAKSLKKCGMFAHFRMGAVIRSKVDSHAAILKAVSRSRNGRMVLARDGVNL
jgi:hypothetical protein